MAALSRQPVAWRREFDGDVSDQGHWLYTEDEADTQDGYSWQPLFLQPPTEEELRAGLELFKRIATRGVATGGALPDPKLCPRCCQYHGPVCPAGVKETS